MTYELWHQIWELSRQQFTHRQIMRELLVKRKAVRNALRMPVYKPRQSGRRGKSILDRYKGFITGMLQRYPDLTAQRLHDMLHEKGYTGHYTVVKDYVRDLRPCLTPADLTLRFAPGECAQVDWGSWCVIPVENTRRKVHIFIMTLCHSRMMYAELSLAMTMEHWLSAHRRAFEFFGGTPTAVMCDHCRTAMLPGPPGGRPVPHPVYATFLRHYHAEVRPCTPYSPEQKGRVEKAVGYARTSFFAGREPAPLPLLSAALADWLETTANRRVHRTTGKPPRELFAAAERAALQPLPATPYDCGVNIPVVANSQFRVILDTNRYSVPHTHASRRLNLRRYPERIMVFDGETLVAQHPRSYDRHQDICDPAHEQRLLLERRHARDQKAMALFLRLGPAAPDYLARLQERRPNWRSHLHRIAALSEIHGGEKCRRALEDALHYQAFSAEYIGFLLDSRRRRDPEPGPLHVPRRQDLLEIEIPEPDLSVYETPEEKDNDEDRTDNDAQG